MTSSLVLSVELNRKMSTEKMNGKGESPVPEFAVTSVSRATGPSASAMGVFGTEGVPVH